MTDLLSIAPFADPEGVGMGSAHSWKNTYATDFPRNSVTDPSRSKRAPRVQILTALFEIRWPLKQLSEPHPRQTLLDPHMCSFLIQIILFVHILQNRMNYLIHVHCSIFIYFHLFIHYFERVSQLAHKLFYTLKILTWSWPLSLT